MILVRSPYLSYVSYIYSVLDRTITSTVRPIAIEAGRKSPWGLPTFDEILSCLKRFDDTLWRVFCRAKGENQLFYVLEG